MTEIACSGVVSDVGPVGMKVEQKLLAHQIHHHTNYLVITADSNDKVSILYLARRTARRTAMPVRTHTVPSWTAAIISKEMI